MVVQKYSCVPKVLGLPVGSGETRLASLIRSIPYPHSLSPIPQTILSLGCFPTPSLPAALQAFLSPALALRTRCVCPLPLYVIDGSYLHGPRRATVGVAVKPPDESFRWLETAPEVLTPEGGEWCLVTRHHSPPSGVRMVLQMSSNSLRTPPDARTMDWWASQGFRFWMSLEHTRAAEPKPLCTIRLANQMHGCRWRADYLIAQCRPH